MPDLVRVSVRCGVLQQALHSLLCWLNNWIQETFDMLYVSLVVYILGGRNVNFVPMPCCYLVRLTLAMR